MIRGAAETGERRGGEAAKAMRYMDYSMVVLVE